MSEADAGDDEPELTFVVDLPEGWCPPPEAARAILAVMLAVQERRANSEANGRTYPQDTAGALNSAPSYKV